MNTEMSVDSAWREEPPRLLHHLLLGHSRRHPGKAAVVTHDRTWTYAELEARARRYAETLARVPYRIGDKVILDLKPGPEGIALIIACSALGLAYVPVSPENPPARKRAIADSTGAILIIRDPADGKGENGGAPTAHIRGEDLALPPGAAGKDGEAPRRGDGPIETDLAYIIFTSGTTGIPKGIMMSHRSVLAFFRGFGSFGVSPDETIGSISPFQFDFFICDMLLALGSGATLALVPSILAHHPPGFVAYLAEKRITQMDGVPSIWRGVLRAHAKSLPRLEDLRAILYAGEAFSPEEVAKLQEALPQARIIQGFGHSESIGCSFKVLPRPARPHSGRISIGKAFPGMEMFQLDEDGKEIREPGRIGEICIRGACLFSGYWRAPEANRAKVVFDPRRPETREPVFLSGDLGFRDETGEFYFYGRKDTQVKFLGNRIELEEIEARLAEHPRIQQAVVVQAQEGEVPCLMACLVLSGEAPDGEGGLYAAIRAFCAEKLPQYMVPARFRTLESIPTTLNGKVDRRAVMMEIAAAGVDDFRARAR